MITDFFFLPFVNTSTINMKYKSAGFDITAACAPPKSPIQTDRCKHSWTLIFPARISTNPQAAFQRRARTAEVHAGSVSRMLIILFPKSQHFHSKSEWTGTSRGHGVQLLIQQKSAADTVGNKWHHQENEALRGFYKSAFKCTLIIQHCPLWPSTSLSIW